MSRRTDRGHIFNLIFQLGFESGKSIEAVFEDYFENHVEDNADREFVYQEFSGACQNLDIIDGIIKTNLKSWTIDRLNKTDLAILRLTVYEMRFASDIPESVSINEAVELAKVFSDDDAPSFVNGVLGSISKYMKRSGVS